MWMAGLVLTGLPVAVRTLAGLLRGRAAADVVAMLAILTAIALGEPLAGLVVVLMQTGGEALERFAEGRASAAVRALEEAAPHEAHRLRADGTVEDIAADAVAVDDLLLVRPGEMVPCDAVVTIGASHVDVSRLTGEPIPLHAGPGTRLSSGSVNGESPLTMRVRGARVAKSLCAHRGAGPLRTGQQGAAPAVGRPVRRLVHPADPRGVRGGVPGVPRRPPRPGRAGGGHALPPDPGHAGGHHRRVESRGAPADRDPQRRGPRATRRSDRRDVRQDRHADRRSSRAGPCGARRALHRGGACSLWRPPWSTARGTCWPGQSWRGRAAAASGCRPRRISARRPAKAWRGTRTGDSWWSGRGSSCAGWRRAWWRRSMRPTGARSCCAPTWRSTGRRPASWSSPTRSGQRPRRCCGASAASASPAWSCSPATAGKTWRRWGRRSDSRRRTPTCCRTTRWR